MSWWEKAVNTRPLTSDDVKRGFEALQAYDTERALRENEALIAFMDRVPEHLRDHPRIRAIASMVAMSQTYPLHPRQAQELREEYEQIVRDHENDPPA